MVESVESLSTSHHQGHIQSQVVKEPVDQDHKSKSKAVAATCDGISSFWIFTRSYHPLESLELHMQQLLPSTQNRLPLRELC